MVKAGRRRKREEDDEEGRWSLPTTISSEGAGELALPLVGGRGRAYDFPLSRDEKVGRLLALFQQEVDEDLVEERAFREEMRRSVKQLKSEFRGLRKIARAAAVKETPSPRATCRSDSPPKTPPTPPPQPRQPRQSAPPAPLGLGRRRSSVVVIPLFPKGFDHSVDHCPGAGVGAGGTGSILSTPTREGMPPGAMLPSPPPRSRRRSSVEASTFMPTPTRSILEATPEEPELFPPPDDEQACSGTIGAIQWSGCDVVDWVRFQPVGSQENWESLPSNSTNEPIFLDYSGEYIKAIYGRAEITDGRSADWVVVETTKRKLQIGNQNVYNPTFAYTAASGHELVGVEIGPCGRIQGARQQLLVP